MHGVQHARVVPVGHVEHVLEVFQAEHVHPLEPGETAIRVVDVHLVGPLLQPVGQRLQVRVAGQYLFETDAGRPDRQVRPFEVRERVDVRIVHRRAQERHQRSLCTSRLVIVAFYRPLRKRSKA